MHLFRSALLAGGSVAQVVGGPSVDAAGDPAGAAMGVIAGSTESRLKAGLLGSPAQPPSSTKDTLANARFRMVAPVSMTRAFPPPARLQSIDTQPERNINRVVFTRRCESGLIVGSITWFSRREASPGCL